MKVNLLQRIFISLPVFASFVITFSFILPPFLKTQWERVYYSSPQHAEAFNYSFFRDDLPIVGLLVAIAVLLLINLRYLHSAKKIKGENDGK